MSQQNAPQPEDSQETPNEPLLTDDDFLAALNEVAELEQQPSENTDPTSQNADDAPAATENPEDAAPAVAGEEDDLDALLGDGDGFESLGEIEEPASEAPSATEEPPVAAEPEPPEPEAATEQEPAPDPEPEPEPESDGPQVPSAAVAEVPADDATEAVADDATAAPADDAPETEPTAGDAEPPTDASPAESETPAADESTSAPEPEANADANATASEDGEADAEADDDELLAALQEVEAGIADPFGGDGDDLSDAFADANFDDAAAPATPEDGSEADGAADDAPTAEAEADETTVLTRPPPGSKSDAKPGKVPAGMSFKLGSKTVGGPAPAAEQPEERPAPKPGRALIPVASVGKRVYRTMDGMLDLLHRPFSRLGSKARTTIGYCAIATIAVSAVSVALLPLLIQRRDAVAFLLEKRAEMETDAQTKTVADVEEE